METRDWEKKREYEKWVGSGERKYKASEGKQRRETNIPTKGRGQR